MSKITIELKESEKKNLQKRAKKNLLSPKEQVEKIVLQSVIRSKKTKSQKKKLINSYVKSFSKEIN